jgi:hypothetical protein
MERALYDDRSLVKHLAMRRTLFVFSREMLPMAQAGQQPRRRRRAAQTHPVGPRVLTALSAAGANRPGLERRSLDDLAAPLDIHELLAREEIASLPEAEGVARLVEQWLRVFGPGTAADIKWWLGSTMAAVRKALRDLDATEPVAAWAALLPPLDPTTMGWFERGWYLGPYQAQLFDTSGNAGPTLWWNGRIVGGWRQSDTGEVILQPLEDVGAEGESALESEAARLTEWLEGTRVLPRFPSPLSQAV